MPDPTKNKPVKKKSVSRDDMPMANRTINNMLRLEPESDFASEIASARTNARFTTSIKPQDTVNITAVTKSGEQYPAFSKKGSPNDIMNQQQGLLPNMFRPISYDRKEDDPLYVGNYKYKAKEPTSKKKTRNTKK